MNEEIVQLIQAISVSFPAEAQSLPVDIQYMPPGKHTIRASKAGKPAELTVSVDSGVVDRLNASLVKLRADGQEPYIDFNHDDQGASGWVKAFAWGGDDAAKGGVRAQIDWTGAGKVALQGRDYRKFSPTFTVDKNGNVSGTTVNAGGLVNRPAFARIAAVVAREIPHQPQPTNMTPEEIQAHLSALEAENKTLKETIKAKARSHAELVVQAAVDEGRIAAKDEKVRARFVNLITEDAANAELLASLPKNPALATVVKGRRPDSSGGTGTVNASELVGKQNSEIAAYKARGLSYEQAYDAARSAKPELFIDPNSETENN